jgi:hypothetical protein
VLAREDAAAEIEGRVDARKGDLPHSIHAAHHVVALRLGTNVTKMQRTRVEQHSRTNSVIVVKQNETK